MNKKVFLVLILLMGVSILGIIAVQVVWMNNAINVRNELFARNVNEALNNTVRKLENIQDYNVVNQMVFSDSLPQVMPAPVPHPPVPPVNIHRFKTPPFPAPGRLKTTKKDIHIEIDTSHESPVRSFKHSFSNRMDSQEMVFSNRSGKGNHIIVFNSDTVLSLDSLFMVSIPRIDSLLEHIELHSLVRPEVSQRVKARAGSLKEMAGKVVTEIATWDVQEPDTALINKVLTEELANQNIPIEFRFAIIRDSIIRNSQNGSDSILLASTSYQTDLYPNSIFRSNMKLAVYFPHREVFIYRSLNWLMIASLLFSLFILITFALSIFYILRQKKISEMKSDFINNMTHEFKTPIATISVAADSIANEKVLHDPDKILYFTGMIKKENTRMNMQVEDILTIARLDRKDYEFTWEPVDMHELIDQAVQSVALRVEKLEGNIIKQFDARNPIVTTDKKHGINMLYNLLDNAIKYSEQPPEIKISTMNRPNGIMVSVEDKGMGMPKNIQARVFEKFYRQTAGNVHNVKGFGLGLSYVKAVIDANRGWVSVSSETGKGSRFDLFLPFTRE